MDADLIRERWLSPDDDDDDDDDAPESWKQDGGEDE